MRTASRRKKRFGLLGPTLLTQPVTVGEIMERGGGAVRRKERAVQLDRLAEGPFGFVDAAGADQNLREQFERFGNLIVLRRGSADGFAGPREPGLLLRRAGRGAAGALPVRPGRRKRRVCAVVGSRAAISRASRSAVSAPASSPFNRSSAPRCPSVSARLGDLSPFFRQIRSDSR